MMHAAVQLKADTPATQQAVQPATRHIGMVLFEGFSLPDMSMVAELFDRATRVGPIGNAHVRYPVRILSERGGCVTSSSSLQMQTEAFGERIGERIDALFVFGACATPAAARDERLLRWLNAAPVDTAVVRPIRGGGACAETQRDLWATPQNTAAPRTTMILDATRAHTDDRDEPVKSALAIVARESGVAAAREIAIQLLPDAAARLLSAVHSADLSVADRIRRSAQWLRENCGRPISVAEAARDAAMSERNYLRRFRLEMGCTPSGYLLQARLDMTRRLLAETELPVDKIARRCGMGNGDNLAKMFRKRWSISPTDYRFRHRPKRRIEVELQPGGWELGSPGNLKAGKILTRLNSNTNK